MRTASIVGVGETDYGADYAAWRAKAPGYEAPDLDTLMKRAFERAVADAGFQPEDVDGLIASAGYEGSAPEIVAKTLGINPRFKAAGSVLPLGMAPGEGVIQRAVAALEAGDCNTVAVVYGSASRTSGRQFGGDTYVGQDRDSYYYYHPWGWSSQAAHWALTFQFYMQTYGATEEDLASVAMTLRAHAVANDNAIMREPLTLDAYLAAPYVVRPLRRLDLCLPNDGAVCLVLQRSDDATGGAHTPVQIAGWADTEIHHSKLKFLVKYRLAPQLKEAGQAALAMAGLTLADIDHFQGYDASTIHLVNQMEGYGFVPAGEGLEFCKSGGMAIGGSLPVNTSGGMLSEAYMHGWNHLAEATRQLRHEAGPRQVEGIEASMFSLATTESAHPIILTRGA
jgi:acetyl-CoA acetyltransferase